MNKEKLKVKLLTEKLEKLSGKKVVLKENEEPFEDPGSQLYLVIVTTTGMGEGDTYLSSYRTNSLKELIQQLEDFDEEDVNEITEEYGNIYEYFSSNNGDGRDYRQIYYLAGDDVIEAI